MTTETHDPRDIPILTDAVAADGRTYGFFDAKAVHAAVVTETLNLADSLLHQAAKDIEATLFERVFDRLRAQLPELVDRVLREHAMLSSATATTVVPSSAADTEA
jgi:Zn-dependent M32 family carboxypeptidase